MYDPATGSGAFAVELVVPSVTSQYNPLGPVTTEEDDLRAASPYLRWTNLRQNGFAVLEVTPTHVQCDFYPLEAIGEDSTGVATWAKGFAVREGEPRAVEADSPIG